MLSGKFVSRAALSAKCVLSHVVVPQCFSFSVSSRSVWNSSTPYFLLPPPPCIEEFKCMFDVFHRFAPKGF